MSEKNTLEAHKQIVSSSPQSPYLSFLPYFLPSSSFYSASFPRPPLALLSAVRSASNPTISVTSLKRIIAKRKIVIIYTLLKVAKRFSRWYVQILGKYPLLTKCVTTFFLNIFSDFIAQILLLAFRLKNEYKHAGKASKLKKLPASEQTNNTLCQNSSNKTRIEKEAISKRNFDKEKTNKNVGKERTNRNLAKEELSNHADKEAIEKGKNTKMFRASASTSAFPPYINNCAPNSPTLPPNVRQNSQRQYANSRFSSSSSFPTNSTGSIYSHCSTRLAFAYGGGDGGEGENRKDVFLTNAVFFIRQVAQKFDFSRMFRQGLLGFVLRAPVGHLWILFVEKVFAKARREEVKTVLSKVILEQLMYGPCITLLNLVSTKMIEGQSTSEIKDFVRTRFLGILKTNVALWSTVGLFQYRFVSPNFRFIIANIVALFWTAYLICVSTQPSILDDESDTMSNDGTEKNSKCDNKNISASSCSSSSNTSSSGSSNTSSSGSSNTSSSGSSNTSSSSSSNTSSSSSSNTSSSSSYNTSSSSSSNTSSSSSSNTSSCPSCTGAGSSSTDSTSHVQEISNLSKRLSFSCSRSRSDINRGSGGSNSRASTHTQSHPDSSSLSHTSLPPNQNPNRTLAAEDEDSNDVNDERESRNHDDDDDTHNYHVVNYPSDQ